jgi:hypothetical protein
MQTYIDPLYVTIAGFAPAAYKFSLSHAPLKLPPTPTPVAPLGPVTPVAP